MEIRSPGSDEEWQQAKALRAEMMEWDVVECRALGFSRDEVVDTFYAADHDEIREASVPPEGGFLLATEAGEPLACAAFHRISDTSCELYDVYVRPAARGRRLATLMIEQLMVVARGAGYQKMVLETATFMVHAHKIYRALGFTVREPYHDISPKWAPVTIWMECRLDT